MATEKYTKIVGVTQSNPDGRPRQKIIQKSVKAGMPLQLVREPKNRYDKNAIAVMLAETPGAGAQLGYLSGDLAADLAPRLDAGQIMDCSVREVTGGDGQNFGVNINVIVYTAKESERMRTAALVTPPAEPLPKVAQPDPGQPKRGFEKISDYLRKKFG
jgi:hypothetical protein